MAKKHRKPPELAHDDREIDVRAIVRYSALLIIFTALASVAMWFYGIELAKEERSGHTAPPPMASTRSPFPPEPRLQPRPRLGLQAHRANEDEELSSYAWVDESNRIAQIPIDAAIEVLAAGAPESRDGKKRWWALEERPMGPPDVGEAAVPNEASLNVHQRTGKRTRLGGAR